MVVGCQPYAPAAFTPMKYSWYSFVLEAESTPGPSLVLLLLLLYNITLSPCLVKHNAETSHASVDSEFHAFVSSMLYGDQWSALYSGRFNPVPIEYESDGPQSQPASSGKEKTLKGPLLIYCSLEAHRFNARFRGSAAM